jgi:hypothetical protein
VMAGCSVQVWGWDRCREEPRIEHVKLDSFDDFPPTCVE